MRILGITETCDLGSMYLRLLAEGHEVRVSVSEPLAQGTMHGLVPRSVNWRDELDWVRAAGGDGIILFEAVGFGELQDRLRSEGFNVIGGSSVGDRLENDRAFAMQLLARKGLRVPAVAEFARAEDALADLKANPRRCVYKASASAGATFVGTFEDGGDIAAFLKSSGARGATNFILMDHVDGVETGVGAYFDGERFLRPACIDWEHKRFFGGNMGELTGEVGTVATFDGSDALFTETLAPLEPLLRQAGHVGYVNLNTIINADGIWPIEFTCRFGYPGYAVLEPLQALSWGDLFARMIAKDGESIPTHSGFALCVVLSTPPFPYSRHEVDAPLGMPVIVGAVPAEHLHLGEVGSDAGQLVTSGVYGWTAVVTGTGPTIAAAGVAAYRHAAEVRVPNLRYRLDIGDELISGDLSALSRWGWLKSTSDSRIASQMVR